MVVSQAALNVHCERVRAAEHAPRDPCRVLERRHGFAEIVERGARVPTFAHLREAKGWLEDAARTARRVLGGPHPTTRIIEAHLEKSVAVLRLSTAQEWRRNLITAMPAYEDKSFEELRLEYLTRTT